MKVHSQELLDSDARPPFPTIRCINCNMIWLVPGLAEGDKYECKRCRSIIVTPDESEPLRSFEDPAEA